MATVVAVQLPLGTVVDMSSTEPSRTQLSQTQHPAVPLLLEALALSDREAAPAVLRELVGIRVSAEDLADATQHLDEASNLYGDHPVVGPFLESLPADVLTSPDEARRRALGLIRVEAQHTHRDAVGKARIGFLACPVIDGVGCVVLIVANTSREEHVELRNGEVRNGWEGLVLAAWAWAASARCMRFMADDRMGRSNSVIQSILKVLKARAGSLLYWGRERLDPHKDGFNIAVSAEKSGAEDDSRRARTTPGFLRAYRRGAWPEGVCPLGTRRPEEFDVRGNPVSNPKAVIESDPSQKVLLEQVLRGYANGLPKSSIAVVAARLGARNGEDRLLAPQLTVLMDAAVRIGTGAYLEAMQAVGEVTAHEVEQFNEALGEPVSRATKALAHTVARDFVNRVLRAVPHLRSGVIDKVRMAPTAGVLEYMGWYPTFVCIDLPQVESSISEQFVLESDLGPDHPYHRARPKRQRAMRNKGFWMFQIECGTPVSLTDVEWSKIDDRRAKDLDEFHRRRPADGNARPLAGMGWTDADGSRVRLSSTGDAATYPVELMPYERDGKAAWVHRHTLNATDVARALGDLLLELATRVEVDALPLIDGPAFPEASTAVNDAERVIADLMKLMEKLKTRMKHHQNELADLDQDEFISEGRRALRRESLEEARNDDEEQILHLEDHELPGARLALESLLSGEHPPAPVEELEQVNANFAHITAVGIGLLRCDPYGPAPLANALGWLLDDGYGLHNLRQGKGPRQVLIDVRVRLPLADGSVEWIEAGTLDLSDSRLSSDRGAERTEDAARRLLRDGEALVDVAARFRWSPSQTLKRVASWLARPIDNIYLRAAAVTAAAGAPATPVGRVLYAHATDGDADLLELRRRFGDWIVDAIDTAYLDPASSWAHGTGWVRRPLGPTREAMLAVAGAGTPGVRRQALVASIDGLRNDEQLKDLLHPGRQTHWQPPLLMNDGWITSHLCERADCPGGGAAPMTGLLPVPELLVRNAAVYCEHCHCPLGSDSPLPTAYRLNWDVGVSVASLGRADGIPTISDAASVPVLAGSLLRSRDVARNTGLPIHVIQRLADTGDIPSSLSATGKRTYDPRQLNSPAVTRVIERARQSVSSTLGEPASYRANQPEGQLLGSRQAADRLGLETTYLRFLVRSGALVNLGSQAAPGYREADLDVLLADLRAKAADPAATFQQAHLLSDVAQRFDVTTSVIKRMVKAEILTEVTLGTATLILESSIDALDPRVRAALDPASRLTTSQVAKLAGITPATITHHCSTGALPAVQLYPRGTLFFLEDEVDWWITERTSRAAGSK